MGRSDANRCFDLAQQIVLRRLSKKRKNKGRKITARSSRQYLRGPFRNDVVSVFLSAAEKAKGIVGITGSMAVASPYDRASVYKFAALLLQADLRHECRRSGRPAPTKGLIASVIQKPVKRNGRPRSVGPEAEERWVHSLWGVAAALWAHREHMSPVAEIDDVIDVLVRQPEWRSELESLFPEAVRDPIMQDKNPPTKNMSALIKRARLARKKYPLPGKLKSGG